MGNRLYVKIPNVNYDINNLELGKPSDLIYEEFFSKRINTDELVHFLDLKEYLLELLEINDQATDHKLYNLDLLNDLVDFAIKNKYDVYFYLF